ncbi:hypothetical protein [Flavobacterium yafengii]|uniref:hypothetical protein n=1 Tax=Flavobacterium yafengii TaxID=3041253 RepID=UPI0024A8ABD5|nr:hypothetical protein [Flavobacterium yafengii]MDI5887631.1 hypothetical protein [Flavobacterium yafengii]
MKKYYCLFIVIAIFMSSCKRKRDCNVEPISLSVMDTTKLKGDLIFKNEKGVIDSLVLLDYHNGISKESIQTLMNKTDCEHSIGYNYESSDGNGIIVASLEKDENKKYSFSVSGFCLFKNFPINQKEVISDSLLIVKVDSCENSKFKELAFRKFRLEYFITQNGDIWKPIKFIPRDLKK